MSLTLEANYSKKIGLPHYSSHQFSLTLRVEAADISQVQSQSNQLYQLLQTSVDRELQQTGFVPQNGHGQGNNNSNNNGQSELWVCTPKQKDLILRIVEENRLNKVDVDQLSQDRFGVSVKQLNTLQASGLIRELLERHPLKDNGNGNGHGRGYRREYRRASR